MNPADRPKLKIPLDTADRLMELFGWGLLINFRNKVTELCSKDVLYVGIVVFLEIVFFLPG